MERTWTEATRLEWIKRRDIYRKQKDLPALESLRTSDNPVHRKSYETALSLERRSLIDRLDTYSTKTASWPLEKPPLKEYRAPWSGKLYLPLSYRKRDDQKVIQFQEGDDLNGIVYAFYNEKAEPGIPGVNYVTHDGVCVKRHEFLGPTPHVAGFQILSKTHTARIEWWDATTHERWIGTDVWMNQVYFDDNVRGWVSKVRSDYSCNLDIMEYLGL